MPLNSEESVQLDQLSDELTTERSLIENKKQLNALSVEQMRAFITRFLSKYTDDDLKSFQSTVEAMRDPLEQKTNFQTIAREGLTVLKCVFGLIDTRNKAPHNLVFNEFNVELFHHFRELVDETLHGNEINAATRIVQSVPFERLNDLSKKIGEVLPESTFFSKVQAACIVRREVENHLLSDDPKTFFTSCEFGCEFNPGLMQEFSQLLHHLLQNREEQIAAKLALLDAPTRSAISKKLEMINPIALNKNHPLRLIAQMMNETKEEVSNDDAMDISPGHSPKLASNRAAFFAHEETTNAPLAGKPENAYAPTAYGR